MVCCAGTGTVLTEPSSFTTSVVAVGEPLCKAASSMGVSSITPSTLKGQNSRAGRELYWQICPA